MNCRIALFTLSRNCDLPEVRSGAASRFVKGGLDNKSKSSFPTALILVSQLINRVLSRLHAEGRSYHEVDVRVVVVGGVDAGVVVDPLLSANEVGGPARSHGQALHELKIRYSINI